MQLRRTLYKQINGVILVYDSTDKASLRRLTKWASEVAADGTFVAPFPDETAARCVHVQSPAVLTRHAHLWAALCAVWM